MDINSLTIGEAKELASLFNTAPAATSAPAVSNPMIGKFCIVRCQKAGVHAGVVVQANDSFVELKDSRRLWFWKSQFTLSESAQFGIQKESKVGTKIDVIIPWHDIGELLPCSSEARKSIESVLDYKP
jgi:hypothetical protein